MVKGDIFQHITQKFRQIESLVLLYVAFFTTINALLAFFGRSIGVSFASITMTFPAGWVAQSIALLLPEIGTPAVSPKPRGKSPGWQVGNKRTKKTRYPVVKKGKTSHKKRTKKSA